MNVPLIVSGSLALLGAAIHGGAGEIFVVRRLSAGVLPSSPFGGPGLTKAMIRVSWHIATIAFLTVGSALILSGSALNGDAARAVGLIAAACASAIAALIGGAGLAQGRRALRSRTGDRSALRVFFHPGPVLSIVVAVLAWIGVT